MERDQGPTGDYGYDLAHEAVRGPRRPDAAAGGGQQGVPAGAEPGREPEDAPAGDLGYDEAHDF